MGDLNPLSGMKSDNVTIYRNASANLSVKSTQGAKWLASVTLLFYHYSASMSIVATKGDSKKSSVQKFHVSKVI